MYDLTIGHCHGFRLENGFVEGGYTCHGVGEIGCQGYRVSDGCCILVEWDWRGGSITVYFCDSGCHRR